MIFFVTALLVTNTLVASTHRLLFLNVVVFLFIFLLFIITLEVLLLDHFLELLDLFTVQLDSHLLCYCNQIRRDLVFKTFHLIVIFLVIVLNSHFISTVIFLLVVVFLILAAVNDVCYFSRYFVFIMVV